MLNLQDYIVHTGLFKKFKVDDLLFVEYKCLVEEALIDVWWHNNFFAYVLAGEMKWKTPRKEYPIKAGQCLFAKKGAIMARTDVKHDYCELLIFVPDEFIKTVIEKYKIPLAHHISEQNCDTIIPLDINEVLEAYFHSLLTFFSQSIPPSETLLKIKFEELIVSLLSTNDNLPLKCYCSDLCNNSKSSIKEIMEANFQFNLSLDEFARLCCRSLSAFKIDFKNIYKMSAGKWLQEKRLEYSKYLLETTDHDIHEIALDSGFENMSHFIRVFKNKYRITPGKYQSQKGKKGQITIPELHNTFI